MKSKGVYSSWFILLIIEEIPALSFNQPKFCPNASWNSNATTFATSSAIGANPRDIFITKNNTVYVPNRNNGRLVVWSNGSLTPTRTISISNSSWSSSSLFVTTMGDVYVDAYVLNKAVWKWLSNATVGIPTMYTCEQCYDLFVDISSNLYCSMGNSHQVVTKSLDSDSNALRIVAGTGTYGSTANMLNNPRGIFVDVNFDLYVADSSNDRVQLFQLGHLNGTTVAGIGSLNTTITLYRPTAIVLDADKYLFIVDHFNHRIVGSGPNGFQCLVGCFANGSASNQLDHPWSLSFDSYGNMFVTDYGNNRVQKFFLTTSLCNTTTTTTETITSTITYVQNSSTDASNSVKVDPLKAISYNRPKFDASANWSANAVTFAASSTVGSNPNDIFINSNNTVYVADSANSRIQIWLSSSINRTSTISSGLSLPFSIFVTIDGDVYVDNGYANGRVDKRTLNTNSSIAVMRVNKPCYGLFVDINDVLYCSIRDLHRVIAKSLDSASDVLTIVAGTGCNGSTSNMLDSPQGIFVRTNFDLYVADSGNNRIQLFRTSELNATTMAGIGAAGTISLNYPTGVVLDADNYLFIVDSGNHRIVGSGLNGFRCLVGCSGSAGSTSNQLYGPTSIAFDSHGNIFVTDVGNGRVQTFLLFNNTSPELTTIHSALPSTTTAAPIVRQESSSSSPFQRTSSSSTNLLPTNVTTFHQESPSKPQTTADLHPFSNDPTSILTPESATMILPLRFSPPACSDPNTIGTNCNISSLPCDLLPLCKNNGTCTNTNISADGYVCTCPPEFDGAQCQLDNRPCKPDTCWNNGICNETANMTFICSCLDGRTGTQCEKIINYCEGVKCENNGVCRPLFLNYTCECLGTSYSGRRCEIVARTRVIRVIVANTFGWISIICLVAAISFFVIMDILKYCFGVDATKDELEEIQRTKAMKRAKHQPVIQRFTYVNALPEELPAVKCRKEDLNVEETTV